MAAVYPVHAGRLSRDLAGLAAPGSELDMSSFVSRLTPLGVVRIHLDARNVDMRKGFDSLHAIIQSEFRRDA